MWCDVCRKTSSDLMKVNLQVPDFEMSPEKFSILVRVKKQLPVRKVDYICPVCALTIGNIIHNFSSASVRLGNAR